MAAGLATERQGSSLRTRSFLFGCALTAHNRKFRFPKGGKELEEVLCLRMGCLGPGAPDEVHVLEAEGSSQGGRPLQVPLASLKFSLQPTVNLGGIVLTPPVTFRLRAGAGPLYVSGQHLVTDEAEDDDDDDDNHGGAAAKRATPAPLGKPAPKRARAPSDGVREPPVGKWAQGMNGPKAPRLASQARPLEAATHSAKGTPANQALHCTRPAKPAVKPAKAAQRPQESHWAKAAKGPPSLAELKAKLLARVQRGEKLPKHFHKFQKFLKHCHRAEDPACVQELWNWRHSLQLDK